MRLSISRRYSRRVVGERPSLVIWVAEQRLREQHANLLAVVQLFDQLRQCLVGGGDLGIVGRLPRPGARRVGVFAGDNVLPGRYPQLVDGGLAPSPQKPLGSCHGSLSWFPVMVPCHGSH